MSPPAFIPIVEGQGEIEAVPILLRRFAERSDIYYIKVNPPVRIKSGSFLNDEEYFKKYIELTAEKARQANGVVLIMLDCEDNCPGTLGPYLLNKAKSMRPDVEYIVILAYREYETWFLAAIASLAGKFGIPDDALPPPNPESIRGAKERMSRLMEGGYDPVNHQAELTSAFDIDAACVVHSFARCCARIKSYLESASA